MLRFAANLSMMFNEVPFLDRFELAAKAGFEAVEFLFPYDWPAEEIAARLERHNLNQALFNGPPGDWDKGDRGFAGIPGREDWFRNSFAKALHYAKALNCQNLHVMSGIPGDGAKPGDCEKTLIANLAWAAEQAAKQNVNILLEPLNGKDVPGYYLNTFTMAEALVKNIARHNVRLQFDIYHAQMIQGRIAETFERLLPMIGHIQIAGVPGRGEPDATQEINFPYIFGMIAASSYQGYVGCEYRPKNGTGAGLAWFEEHRRV